MRVKKLSANRRPKAGEDDVGSDSNSSPGTHKWASPTKHDGRELGSAASSGEIGSNSPTDPSGVHPLGLSDNSVQAHFFAQQATTTQALHPTTQLFFGDTLSMANTNSHPMVAARDMTGRKPATLKKANGAANWREQVSSAVRDEIHAKIVEYLKALKPNAPEKVLARLPGLANRMEESLLQLASSQEEYADLKTLAPRFTAIQQSNAKKLLQQQTVSHSSPTHGQDNNNGGSSANRTPLSEDQARFVFQCLQSWRQKLVNMYGVAPWDILPNQILAKVAVYAPSTEQELAVCGVHEDLIARFGSSLLKELQLICGSTASAQRTSASPSGAKSHSSAGANTSAAKASRKAESSKRPADPKKRKTSNLAPAAADHSSNSNNSRLAPAPSSFMMPPPPGTPNAMIPPSQLLFRPSGLDSLTTLLPPAGVSSSMTATNSSTTSVKSPYNSNSSVPATRLSPGLMQQPFFPRLQSPPTPAQIQQQQQSGGSDGQQENNHMHLLAQGAGHMSKQQQDAKTIDMYEKELHTMRWLLQQSQQEKTQLEDEVQRLRRQLGASQGPRQSVESQ